MHPSGDQKDGSWRAINRDCRGGMRKNKFTVQNYTGKVMARGLEESEGTVLVEFLKRCAKINSD